MGRAMLGVAVLLFLGVAAFVMYENHQAETLRKANSDAFAALGQTPMTGTPPAANPPVPGTAVHPVAGAGLSLPGAGLRAPNSPVAGGLQNTDALQVGRAVPGASRLNETIATGIGAIQPILQPIGNTGAASGLGATSTTPGLGGTPVIVPDGSAAGATNAKVYQVQKGDSLWSISRKIYGTDHTSKIIEANGLKSDRIRLGQKLTLPEFSRTTRSTSANSLPVASGAPAAPAIGAITEAPETVAVRPTPAARKEEARLQNPDAITELEDAYPPLKEEDTAEAPAETPARPQPPTLNTTARKPNF